MVYGLPFIILAMLVASFVDYKMIEHREEIGRKKSLNHRIITLIRVLVIICVATVMNREYSGLQLVVYTFITSLVYGSVFYLFFDPVLNLFRELHIWYTGKSSDSDELMTDLNIKGRIQFIIELILLILFITCYIYRYNIYIFIKELLNI